MAKKGTPDPSSSTSRISSPTISEKESVTPSMITDLSAKVNAKNAQSVSGSRVIKAMGPQRAESKEKLTNLSVHVSWSPEAMISNTDTHFDVFHDPQPITTSPQAIINKSRSDRSMNIPTTQKSNPTSRLHDIVDKIAKDR